ASTASRATTMQTSPLHAEHLALGAKLVEFGGWQMPVQYGPILEEVRCVRERGGLFDLCHMGRLRISGGDTLAFCDRLFTNFVARIPEGAIRYALLCREDGNPIDDVLVYRDGDEIFVVVNAANCAADLAWLREHAGGFAVEITDQSAELAMVALQGQISEAVLQELTTDLDLSTVGYYRFARGTVLGVPEVLISRTGYTGEDGFEVYYPTEGAVELWRALLAAGEALGLAPIGLGARDTLRLEAGMPLYGHEIDGEHNPIEAGLSFGISFKDEKGAWIGRAALAQARDNLKRRLVGIQTAGKRAPRQGYPLMRGDEQVGLVTSGAISPTVNANIGMAYLNLGQDQAGTTVELDIRGRRQECTVCELPFYSRKR
ncbi:MAG: glycine cleavage system aminomethyltransferase GcvT, partial [Planctomycetota bacterium]|nr:glycine cleavage system aminomethyltransferase GcvT [Planctomycetota bacterium]